MAPIILMKSAPMPLSTTARPVSHSVPVALPEKNPRRATVGVPGGRHREREDKREDTVFCCRLEGLGGVVSRYSLSQNGLVQA